LAIFLWFTREFFARHYYLLAQLNHLEISYASRDKNIFYQVSIQNRQLETDHVHTVQTCS